MHRLSQLVLLHRLGKSAREVARLLGMSPNTEREYRLILHPTGLLSGCPEQLPSAEELQALVLQGKPEREHAGQQSRLAPETQCLIRARYRDGAQPAAIYDWLRREHPSVEVSKSALKRYVAKLRRELGPSERDVAIAVETAPGEVAQVDFGSVGKLWDPSSKSMRDGHVFVMVLGYSRHAFYRIVFDQKIETWLALHQEAFRYLGGVPRTIVPDNLKAAVIRAAFDVRSTPELHLSYRDFARHYGFLIDPTPPYQPQKKGKVEAAVKYVKNNFFAAIGDEKDARVLNEKLDAWNHIIAGQRVHGTTARRPAEVFEANERKSLLALPARAWAIVTHRRATVRRDAHALIDGALYSVPWNLVGQAISARLEKNKIAIFHADTLVATHRRVEKGQRVTTESHLPDSRRKHRQRSIEYWRDQAAKIGPEVTAFIDVVIATDKVLSPLRHLIPMVNLLQATLPSRAEAACRRAARYGAYGYVSLKNILADGLESEPIEMSPPSTSLENPRFARPVSDFLPERGYLQ